MKRMSVSQGPASRRANRQIKTSTPTGLYAAIPFAA